MESSGPEEEHLTVIDVPGMFENETPGLTTTTDIELVKNLVEAYIKASRTIILRRFLQRRHCEPIAILDDDQGELDTVLAEPYDCVKALSDDILQHIEEE